MITHPQLKWFGLALLSAVQFMVVLDIAIVNVALPSIQTDLHFSQENLQWVVSAYALAFGGFLLLGGRTADVIGRRRVFVGGILLFTLGSLLCGLAWSDASLIGARAVQGLGAAAISPAALAIVMTSFREGRDRNIALGVWGAVGGFGAAAGVLLGGVLTDALSWEWVFFVNIPVGLVALSLVPVLLSESHDARVKTFDVLGAVLITGGLSTLVLAITQGHGWGWTSGRTIGTFAVAAVMLVGFVVRENRAAEPLMRFGILRTKTLLGANVSAFILGTVLFSMFLMLTLYMQNVLGYSAMKAGVAYLAVAGTSIIWANVAAALVSKVGVRPLIALGMALLTVGMLLFTQIGVGDSYVSALLPGLPDRRHGYRVLLRADLDRRACRRAGGGGRARVRAVQHLAAGRRRSRHRAAVDDRGVDHRRQARLRNRGPGRLGLWLPGGLLGRSRDRRDRFRCDAGAGA